MDVNQPGAIAAPCRRVDWQRLRAGNADGLLDYEWLVTNGLGGSASGAVTGSVTRQHHGLLVAALPAPHGRTVMLSHLDESLLLPDGSVCQFGGYTYGPDGQARPIAADCLVELQLESGLPTWRYEVAGLVLEKRIVLPHLQNTVYISYQLLSGTEAIQLVLRPFLSFRPHDHGVDAPGTAPYTVTAIGETYEIAGPADLPSLRLLVDGSPAAMTLDGGRTRTFHYPVEEHRGYAANGSLWTPGFLTVGLAPTPPDASGSSVAAGSAGQVTLLASTESWEVIRALPPVEADQAERGRRSRLLQAAPPAAQAGMAAELVLAADQFIISPAGRSEDLARAHATGDDVKTVIAGYPWFTDWGRDTMISLEGLTLTTGRAEEAGAILHMFARHVRDGLIPNLFPEGENEGLYHTADATLWFFHALDRYLTATDDRVTLQALLPTLQDIVRHHVQGTRFGIGVDPADGLLRQGAEGYQLTWMDAKVDGWVVTPRRGKAVEINALWYNALCLLAGWLKQEHQPAAADEITSQADRARTSFNQRFWYEAGGYLYDVVDGESGDDPACRPNQIFAVSLGHPILADERQAAVVTTVRERLLTPVGLRSLAPGDPDYHPYYVGHLRERDAAYHQGTVWAWLAGPFVDAWLRVYPDDLDGARQALRGFEAHLGEACLGTISEIFDAEPPHTPRGCIAQAWSVAEVLRALVRLG
ncbi:MAG: amylo-alpha-1,6-glucosidase [Chloroflexota bacterium]